VCSYQIIRIIINMLKTIFFRKEFVFYVSLFLFGILMSAMAASASSTISTNISTDGTLTVTGASALTGAVNASSTLATSGNMTVVAGYGLDTAGGGVLNLGTTTATSVIIGSSSAKVGIASTSPYVALGVTGTTTASLGMVIGGNGSGVSQLLFGTCTPTIGALTGSSTVSVICTGSEAVNGTGWRVFVTPKINGAADEDKDIIFVSASSTTLGIQVSVLNVNLSGLGTRNPTDNAWYWMALR